LKISRAVGGSKAIIAIRHKSPDASIIVNTTCEADDDIHGVDDEDSAGPEGVDAVAADGVETEDGDGRPAKNHCRHKRVRTGTELPSCPSVTGHLDRSYEKNFRQRIYGEVPSIARRRAEHRRGPGDFQTVEPVAPAVSS
jgi:hypothetical protein